MKTSESIKELAAAMVKVQKSMRPASKDALNPHFKSKYADLSSVWEACRGPLNDNNITVWQNVTSDEKSVSVFTLLVHTSGEWVEFGPLSVPLTKMSAHEVGSATSYGKRYALAAAIGVVSEEDDDGNAATGTTPMAKANPEPTSKPGRPKRPVPGPDDELVPF